MFLMTTDGEVSLNDSNTKNETIEQWAKSNGVVVPLFVQEFISSSWGNGVFDFDLLGTLFAEKYQGKEGEDLKATYEQLREDILLFTFDNKIDALFLGTGIEQNYGSLKKAKVKGVRSTAYPFEQMVQDILALRKILKEREKETHASQQRTEEAQKGAGENSAKQEGDSSTSSHEPNAGDLLQPLSAGLSQTSVPPSDRGDLQDTGATRPDVSGVSLANSPQVELSVSSTDIGEPRGHQQANSSSNDFGAGGVGRPDGGGQLAGTGDERSRDTANHANQPLSPSASGSAQQGGDTRHRQSSTGTEANRGAEPRLDGDHDSQRSGGLESVRPEHGGQTGRELTGAVGGESLRGHFFSDTGIERAQTPVARYNDNLEAIKTLKGIELGLGEKAFATPPA
ncbi:hypothetical protein [Helicobacter suis]|uniref:hypothetical protein n=1 Tax=Helicobacter suis TaxID=104628 RepID=UPI001315693E|nr:hypothetical protein [Helicobacter suis]